MADSWDKNVFSMEPGGVFIEKSKLRESTTAIWNK